VPADKNLRSSERVSSCQKGVWGNSSLSRQPPKSLMPTYSVINLKGNTNKLSLAHITSQVTNETQFSVITANTYSSPVKEQEPMKHDAML